MTKPEKEIVLRELGYLHDLLKQKDHWYIEIEAPLNEEIMEIGEKAKGYADKRLSKITTSNLYTRFIKWEREEQVISFEDSYYLTFLRDLAWDLGLSALKGEERKLYCESVNLKIRFNK